MRSSAGTAASRRGSSRLGCISIGLTRGKPSLSIRSDCGCNSVVECQLPKLDVAGSSPVTRSNLPSAANRSTAGRGRLICPNCGTKLERENAPYAPFCSRRCKLIDLGEWFDERYRIPGDPVPNDGESTPEDDE